MPVVSARLNSIVETWHIIHVRASQQHHQQMALLVPVARDRSGDTVLPSCNKTKARSNASSVKRVCL